MKTGVLALGAVAVMALTACDDDGSTTARHRRLRSTPTNRGNTDHRSDTNDRGDTDDSGEQRGLPADSGGGQHSYRRDGHRTRVVPVCPSASVFNNVSFAYQSASACGPKRTSERPGTPSRGRSRA